ncbi:MAG: multicopper oxidase domain-containing protein [Acidobacteria bacterium]|nr:multicopper oxidase domain-containing protein [Acidobacteriota bacterium]
MKESPRKPASTNPNQAQTVTRRTLLKAGVGGIGLAGAAAFTASLDSALTPDARDAGGPHGHGPHLMPAVVGEVNHEKNGFNPTQVLTDFDAGTVSILPNGQTLHEYTIIAINKAIEIVPGLEFSAWTYNGRIPGPTLRVREGDRVRIQFRNGGDHEHSIHFHGIHSGDMDGVFDAASGVVAPGGSFVYEFDAEPFGLHLYHCHTFPLAQHIAKGLYGAFIVDPKQGRPTADHELVMVMSGYDVDFDGANDFYVVNGIPFHYDHDKHPIRIKVGELVRVYLVNILEFDPSNSFHLHANFFHYYPTGTSLTPAEFTDTIALMQGQRGILEFRYKFPGRYMFHAHKTEFAELGWTGVFEVEG